MAEFAENRSKDSHGVFYDSTGFEYDVVCCFLRAQIADGGIPGDHYPLDFYPANHDKIFEGIQNNRVFAFAVHPVGELCGST